MISGSVLSDQPFPATDRTSSVCLRYIFLLYLAGLQLPEILTEQFITGGHLPDVLLDICRFILDTGSDSFPLVHSLRMLDFYFLLWPGYYSSGKPVAEQMC